MRCYDTTRHIQRAGLQISSVISSSKLLNWSSDWISQVWLRAWKSQWLGILAWKCISSTIKTLRPIEVWLVIEWLSANDSIILNSAWTDKVVRSLMLVVWWLNLWFMVWHLFLFFIMLCCLITKIKLILVVKS